MWAKWVIGLVIASFLVMMTTLFTVKQTERALVSRLGNLVMDPATQQVLIYEPGLHVKMPFISNVIKLDERIQTLDIPDQQVVTKEQKFLNVNLFVKWQVHDFSEFYKVTRGDYFRAEQLLAQRANNSLRAEFGKADLKEVVDTKRESIMQAVQEDLNKSTSSLGVRVVDVRIKQIELPQEVNESIYQRMRTEREEQAAQYRASGSAAAEEIQAGADRRVTEALAAAQRDANTIRGEGDAKAAQIYSQAYGQDPEFFAFYESLNAYNRVFKDKNDILVLQPEGDFFKYFNSEKKAQ
ncbi:MAG: protease modulator HflC [Gammaproteobacteria bacterium]